MTLAMIERIVTLWAEYVATVGALAQGEAELDVQRLRRSLRARLIGAAVLVLGVAWLNVALLLWLLSTASPVTGAALIAVAVLAVGVMLWARAGRAAEPLQLFAQTRRVLGEELGMAGGLGVREGLGSHQGVEASAAPVPMTAEEAGARLRAIREAVRETATFARGAGPGVADEPAAMRFEPRSRTMRTAMWVWRVLPRVPAGAALASAVGVLAVGNPRLRRLAAVLALLRNLGGRPRPADTGRDDYAGPRTSSPF